MTNPQFMKVKQKYTLYPVSADSGSGNGLQQTAFGVLLGVVSEGLAVKERVYRSTTKQ